MPCRPPSTASDWVDRKLNPPETQRQDSTRRPQRSAACSAGKTLARWSSPFPDHPAPGAWTSASHYSLVLLRVPAEASPCPKNWLGRRRETTHHSRRASPASARISAFKEIPRNTERVIPVSVRYAVPAGPTYREPQPIRDIYRVGEIFLRRLAPGARTPAHAQSQPRPERCCRSAVHDAHDGHRRPIRVLSNPLHRWWGSPRHTLRGSSTHTCR